MKHNKHRLLFLCYLLYFKHYCCDYWEAEKYFVRAEAQKRYCKNIIRFHVETNSDSEYDQQLKA